MRYAFFSFLVISLSAQSQIDKSDSADSTFINIRTLSPDLLLDLKYASDDNFLKTAVYDCAACYLRRSAAEALVSANEEFKEKGYRLKIYDCYRPLDIQKKMWELVPDPDYVADPSKGSLHNRGMAVDLTLVDEKGIELDMGTTFDFFGPESAFDYSRIPRQARKNRKLLNKIMKRHGFRVLQSEWWHFNFWAEKKASLANFKWKCD